MWKHVIIDDFLTTEHFNHICDAYESKIMTVVNDENVEIHPEDDTPHKITKEFVQELNKTYIPKLLDILKELAPEKVEQYHHARINFVVFDKDHMFPIHSDSKNKLLSVVVYLKPENNYGTVLYETKDGKNPVRVKWKPNRALIFSRSNDTWHSFQSDGVNPRYTLIITLTHRKEFESIKTMNDQNEDTVKKRYKAMRDGEWQKRLDNMIKATATL